MPGGQPQADDAHVGHRAIADDVLQVGLGQARRRRRRQCPRWPEGHELGPIVEAHGQQNMATRRHGEGAQLHEHSGMEHGHRAWARRVAYRRPGVERPDRSQDPEAEEQHHKGNPLGPVGEVGGVQPDHVEGLEARRGIEQQDAGNDETAAGHEIQGELHGGVFFAGGAPDQDEDVHGHHGDLIEQEEHKEIVGHEDAEDPGDQGQHPDEVFLGALLQLPHGEDAGKDDDTGEQQQGGVQTLDTNVVGDAEGLHPLVLLHELQTPQGPVIGHKGVDRQSQGDARSHQGYGLDEELLIVPQAQEDQQSRRRGQQHAGENGE